MAGGASARENALQCPWPRSATGILRLRECLALRPTHYAQDDKLNVRRARGTRLRLYLL